MTDEIVKKTLKAWSSSKDVLSSSYYNHLLFYFRQTKNKAEVEQEEKKLFTADEVKELLKEYEDWWQKILKKKEEENLEEFLRKQQQKQNLPAPPVRTNELIPGSRTGRNPWMGTGLNPLKGGYLVGSSSRAPWKGGISNHPWSQKGFFVDPNADNYDKWLAEQRKKRGEKS